MLAEPKREHGDRASGRTLMHAAPAAPEAVRWLASGLAHAPGPAWLCSGLSKGKNDWRI